MGVMLARESRLRASADRAAANAGLAAASSALRQGDLGGVHRYLESVSESERGWEHDWLSSVMAKGDLVLEHREGDVISVDIFPETSDRPSILLATGYRGTWAYELPDCRLRWELEELPTGSWKHAMVPGEDQLLVCGLGPILKVLDFDTGATLRTFETPGAIGAMLPLSEDWVLLGGDDGRLSRMDLRDGSIHDQTEVNLGGVTCMLQLEDGRILAGTGLGSLLEIDSHLSEVRVARKFARMIPRIRADASESRIAVCTHDNAVEILDAATLETTMRLEDHLADVWDARFDEENDRIVTVSLDESIRVFDLATGKTLERRSGPLVYVWSLAMEDDGRHVWIGCRDGSVRRLQLRQTPVKVPEGEIAGQIAWSPDGRSLVIRTDRGIHRLDVATRSWTASEVVPCNDPAVRGLQPGIIWSASAIWCASGRGGGLWRFDPDLTSGFEVIRDAGVSALALVGNDGVLAGLDDGRLVRVSEDGEILMTASLEAIVQDIDIHPITREAYCLSIGRTNGGMIIDCDSLEQKGVLLEYGVGPAYSLAISNDGSRLAYGGRERPGNVTMVSGFPEKDVEVTRRIGHSGDARFVAFIDGGRRLVSGGDDGRVFLGRVDATQPILTMFELAGAIRGLATSPDGRSIATTDGRSIFLATAP
jgi:WD40 repeat protein